MVRRLAPSLLLLLLAPPALGDTRGRSARRTSLTEGKAPSGEAGAGPAIPREEEFTACKRYPDGKRFKLSLHGEVTVPEMVAVIGDIGCQTIVVGPAVAARGGKVALEVPDLVTAPEVFRLFHAALESLGLTIQKVGALWKVVDAARAQEVSTFVEGGATPGGELFVTRLLRVQRASVADVGDVLGKLRSHDGAVVPYPPGQSLVVTDHASNVRRMEEVARALDVAQPGERIFAIAAHTQTATELGATIDKVLQATRRPGQAGGAAAGAGAAVGPGMPGAAALVPVDAARLLLVVGDEVGYRKVAALAQRIDPAPLDGGVSQTHVIYLSHTNAEEMAATLSSLGLTGRGQQSSARPGAPPSTAVPLQGDVRLAPDKVSNAIVVFGGGPDYLMVRDLIGKLDLPRRQVYVEVAILDVSVDRGRQVGISAHGGETSGDTTVVGASSSKSLTSLVSDTASLASLFGGGGLATGVFGKSFTWNGITVPSFGVVLKALETSKNVNVLSQPHLLTMDNVKASLSVGQSIPFQTQSLGSLAAATSTTTSLLSSYQRQDVALKLELTPHLNDSDSIRLELDGEISDVPDGQSTSAAGGPTTNKRTLKTSVVVSDGETVVLGGLQKDSESESIERVPGLGEIPILGRLFQYKTKQRTKQDLLIAITPFVIRGPEDLRRIFERKQQDQREFNERFNTRPNFDAPVDYGRKRGLLEEINVAARQAEKEVLTLREAARGARRPPVEGEVLVGEGAPTPRP